MKPKLIKMVVWMLLVILVAGALGGCGGKKKEDPTVPSGDEEPIDEPNGEEPQDESDKMDLKGAEITIAHFWDEAPQLGTRKADRQLEIQEKYDCKITWINVAANEYFPKFTASAISGQPEAEVWILRSQWFPSGMRKNLMYDLTELIDPSDTEHYKFLEMESIASYKGRLYGFYPANRRTRPVSVMLFNKALAERQGVEDIYKAVENKTWTWNKMLEYAITATKDSDGDGEIDQWGIAGLNPMQLIYSNGGKMTVADGDSVKVAFDSSESIEALEFYADCINKHKVVGGGQDAFLAGNALFWDTVFYKLGDFKESMVDPFGVTFVPLGPKGENYVTSLEEIMLYAMPSSAKYPKETLRIMEIFSEPYETDEPPAPPEASYEPMVHDEESVRTLMKMETEAFEVTDYLAWQGWSSTIWNIFGEIAGGEVTPQSAIDGIKDEMQAGIESVLSN